VQVYRDTTVLVHSALTDATLEGKCALNNEVVNTTQQESGAHQRRVGRSINNLTVWRPPLARRRSSQPKSRTPPNSPKPAGNMHNVPVLCVPASDKMGVLAVLKAVGRETSRYSSLNLSETVSLMEHQFKSEAAQRPDPAVWRRAMQCWAALISRC
jgi:hypothetical protein